MLLLVGLVIAVMLVFHRDAAEECHEREVDRVLLMELMGHVDEPRVPNY